jgi:quinoprotein glucose dehydrogenase
MKRDCRSRRAPGSPAQGWLMRAARIGITLALFGLSASLNAQTIPGALPDTAGALAKGEWPVYGGTYAATRYSPLTQIDRSNAKNLHIVWRWKSPDQAIKSANPAVGPSYENESTPIMVGGTLYTSTSLSQVAAIDAATGETRWVFDPKIYENGLGLPANFGWVLRGVAYWRGGEDERIVILTAFAQMIELDAKTGKPVPTFGLDGRIDLTQGLHRPVDRDYYTMTSPPLIVHGVIVVGPHRRAMFADSTSTPGICCGPSIRCRRERSPASRPGKINPGSKPAIPMSGRR